MPKLAGAVEAALGGPLLPIATLGAKECITGNLLAPISKARWCLLPTSTLEVLIFPRKDWADCLKPQTLAFAAELAKSKGNFFWERHAAALREVSALINVSADVTAEVIGYPPARNEIDR